MITVPEAEGDITDEERVIAFLQTNIRDSIARGAAIIASQPFHVITIRTMVQFVGGEENYRGIFSSVREIWKHDGVWGFFSGVIPRLAGELLALWLASSLTFLLNTYLVDNKDLQAYTSASMAFIASALTYPFTLVSNIMCVTDCGLAAGHPPLTPIYANWIDCWSHLSSQNQLKRGSSLLWRYYQGPQVLVNGQPRAVGMGSFQPISKKM
jgi:carrier protein